MAVAATPLATNLIGQDADIASSASSAVPGRWRLLYFDAPTRGEQVRLLFTAAKVDFDDEKLDYPKGLLKYKKAQMGDASPLMFDQCPAVTSPLGQHVSQVAACMQFVGRSTGLAPDDPAMDSRAMALTLGSEDLRNTVFYKLLMPMAISAILRTKFGGCLCCCAPLVRFYFGVSKVLPAFRKQAAHLEAALRLSGGDFFCGATMCYADVALFDSVRECLALDCFDEQEQLAGFPELCKFLARMENIPELQAYLERRGSLLDCVLRKYL
jgi:glutathione S-transferase